MAYEELDREGAHDEEILAMIEESMRTRQYPPSIREIANGLGLRSSSTVHETLRRMQRRGLIEIDPRVQRGIRVVRGVAAGEAL